MIRSGLPLVRADHLALQLDRTADHVAQQDRLLEAHQRLSIRLQRPEQLGVADHRHLDDLRPARRIFALRQRLQQSGCPPPPATAGETRRSGSCRAMVETPVLPPMLESTCASSVVGTCGRDAAQERRRDEADHVADHAAADRDDEIAPISPDFDQPVVHRLDAAQVLPLLAAVGRQHLDVPPELPTTPRSGRRTAARRSDPR